MGTPSLLYSKVTLHHYFILPYALPTCTYPFQILALRGIGKVRALRIFTERNTGYTFSTLEDFADCVNMNEKTLKKFLQANAADIMV